MEISVKIEPAIEEGWKKALEGEFNKPYFKELKSFLLERRNAGVRIYPEGSNIFAAFNLTPFEQVKVVILGQDPYHGENQAHGLCFSVKEGMPFPPSLKNIFKEIQSDLGINMPVSGDLTQWAKQGVFLLNAILTVEAGLPTSHQKRGWENFTDAVIKALSDEKSGLIFLLWGNFAQSKSAFIDTNKHFILKAAHPSPLSAHSGFLGCKHFSRTNELLKSMGKKPIDWNLCE